MRLFDKVLSQGSARLRDMGRAMSQESAVLCVDEIARHYNEHEQLQWCNKDYPYARPPWKMCFVEWHESEFIRNEHGLQKGDPSVQIGAFAAFMDATDSVENTLKMLEGLGHVRGQVPPEAVHVCLLSHVCFFGGRVVDTEAITFLFMTESGLITNLVHTGVGMQRLIARAGTEVATRHFNAHTHVIALAFTFANCANVKLENMTEELAPPAKIRRRLKLPEIRRYTLNICGHATAHRERTQPGEVGIMPWHLCRGHFATYTEEKPRFGRLKDGVGRFWIEPHMRGKKEKGEVHKDYAVAEPASAGAIA